MLSRVAADAAVALRGMAGDLRRAAEEAGAGLVRIDAGVGGIAESWSGPAPDDFGGVARLAMGTVAPWPHALDAAAATLERWAGRADGVGLEARRAERRLAVAFDADPVDRDVLVRSARSLIGEVEQQWADTCRHGRLELVGSMNTLATIADRAWGVGDRTSRATEIATMVAGLDMDLDLVDATGTVQSTITGLLDDVMASPVGPLVFTILETARERDLFTADGDLSDDDLAAATDPVWVREAVGVWQQATGLDLGDDVAVVVAGLVPMVASLMQADRARDWPDEELVVVEPALRAVLADAAVASFTRAPGVFADRDDVDVDAVTAFVSAGSGDIDTLAESPTAGEWSYHLHGPPSVGEQFETSDVFRTLLFDWEQVWGEDRSWFGGGFEVAAALPIGKATKLAKAGKIFDRADDAIDLTRIPKLAEIAPGVYKSPAGLVYRPGSGQGHRTTHVLEHLRPNPNKPVHTVFQSEAAHFPNAADELFDLLDEAWAARGAEVADDPGHFIVPMGRVIGSRGEAAVEIIVRPGSSDIITAFPS